MDCLVQLDGGKWKRRQVTFVNKNKCVVYYGLIQVTFITCYDGQICISANLQVSMQNGKMVIEEDEKEVERLQTVLEHWATIGTSGFASWSRGRGGEKGRTWHGCLANKHCH